MDHIERTPARRRGSIRLTSHIDIEQASGGRLGLLGAARWLRTDENSEVLGEAQLRASVGSNRELARLLVSPGDVDTSPLLGSVVGAGFRAKVDEIYRRSGITGVSRLLLDDLPVAVLISGYASLYGGDLEIEPRRLEAGLLRADICSGWRSGGTMLATLEREGELPVPVGPPAIRIEPPGDPLSWHALSPLRPGAMRRRRLVDVVQVQGHRALEIFAMFRDTHVDQEEAESVLHEYSFSAELDPSSGELSRCEAIPGVLPWPECPAAAQSASRLSGLRLEEVAAYVSRELRGTSTCTHLNDLLRSIAHVSSLLPMLARTGQEDR